MMQYIYYDDAVYDVYVILRIDLRFIRLNRDE